MMKNKKGFTLAEVLITLVVIGIVAAMTIPNMIVNYQKKVTITKLKKIYTMLNQTLKMVVAENGEAETWDYKNPIFAEYVRNIQNVTPIKYYEIKSLDGLSRYGYVNGLQSSPYYQMPDGSVLIFRNYLPGQTYDWSMNYAYYILIDVNGKSGPNIAGHDVFTFLIPTSKSKAKNRVLNTILPNGYYLSLDELLANTFNCPSGKSSSASNYIGTTCAARLIKNNWEFDKDYPW